MLSDLSDEEIEVLPGVKVPAKNIEYIKRKNELRALERHVINLLIDSGEEAPEETEKIDSLLRRRSLRLLMEEKAAKTRAEPRWLKFRRVATRRAEAKATSLRRNVTRRTEIKSTKYREVDLRSTQPQLTELEPIQPVVRGEQLKYQWVEQETRYTTEYKQVEPITIESQWTELQRAQPQWVELRQVQVEPQTTECVLLEPPQATPVMLTPVESAQLQYAEIQEVTEVRVVKKIRIYEEIIEE